MNTTNTTNNNNSTLFFKVWHNKFLRFTIFKYLKLYNQLYNVDFEIDTNNENSLKFYKRYKYSEYLRSIKIKITSEQDNQESTSEIIRFIKSLPRNIERLLIKFKSSLTTCGPIKSYKIPNHIRELYIQFPDNYRHPINKSTFSKTFTDLVSIKFSNFNQIIEPDVLPNTLKNLDLGEKYSEYLKLKSIPSSVTQLNIGKMDIPDHISSMVHLSNFTVNKNKDNLIESLPNNIRNLIIKIPFEYKYGQPQKLINVESTYFPYNLETLKIESLGKYQCYRKNYHPLDNDKLTSKPWFQNPCIFSHQLTKLVCDLSLSAPLIKNNLPEGLLVLKVKETDGNLSNSFPPKLNTIHGISSIKELKLLPTKIKNVGFDQKFNQQLSPGDIPPHITSLSFGWSFLNSGNRGLKTGTFESNSCLKFIKFKSPPLNLVLQPYGYFSFPYSIKYPIESDSLPPNLKYLEFQDGFMLSLKSFRLQDSLPSTLTVIVFPNNFILNKHIKFPPTLKALKFTIQKCQIINYDNINKIKQLLIQIPESVLILTIDNYDKNNNSVISNQFETEINEIHNYYMQRNDDSPIDYSTFNLSLILPQQIKKLIIFDSDLLGCLNSIPNSLVSIYTNNDQIESKLKLKSSIFNKLTIVNKDHYSNSLKLFKKLIKFKNNNNY